MPKIAELVFSGGVQGVSFRAEAKKKAETLKITGTIENCSDGRVKARLFGDVDKIAKLIEYLFYDYPPAHVESIDITWKDSTSIPESFVIVKS